MSVIRRRFLATVATVATVGLGGCLTLSPRVAVDGITESEVFDRIQVSTSWAIGRVRASVTLTQRASTKLGVRQLTVISDGSEFWSGSVAPGQTTVSTVQLPTNATSTLLAVSSDGKIVDQVTVRVSGTPIP